MATVHEYPVTVEWKGGREGSGTLRGGEAGVTAALAVGVEFQGTGAGTNPEELLTGAIASCYSMTYGIIAANRRIPLAEIRTETTGQVEQNGPQITYIAAIIRPTITLQAGATDDQVKLAEDMAHKADLYCIITNAVREKVKISVEPKIIRN